MFANLRALHIHINRTHGEELDQTNGADLFVSPPTMFHIFAATQTICKICQEVFTTNIALQIHEKVGHI